MTLAMYAEFIQPLNLPTPITENDADAMMLST
jgi:hypothetical protein